MLRRSGTALAAAMLAVGIAAGAGLAPGATAGAQLTGPQTRFTVQVPGGSVLSDGYYFNTTASDVILSGDDAGFTVQLNSGGGKVFRLAFTPSTSTGTFPAGVTEAVAGSVANVNAAGIQLTEVGGPPCDSPYGSFRIEDLAKSGATITRLALTYNITCAGNVGASAFGTLFIDEPPGPLGGAIQSEFVPITPVRLVDTRTTTPVGAQAIIDIDVAANGSGVPLDATAVVLNVTAVAPSADTYLALFPKNRPPAGSIVSNVNARAGDTVANGATVRVGDDHAVQLFNGGGSTDVVVDIVGYYVPDDAAAGNGRDRFVRQTPQRKLDTRRDGQTALAPGEIRLVDLGTNADAALINLTVVDPSAGGYLTAFPAGQSSPPLASTLNFTATQTVANSTIVKLDGGQLKLYNPVGASHVVIDVLATFVSDPGGTATGRFVAVDPFRLYDSRSAFQLPLFDGETRSLEVLRLGHRFTFEYDAFVANMTAANTTAAGFFLAYPASAERPPLASNLNWAPGEIRANQIVAGHGGVDAFGFTSFYHEGGRADLILDIAGYYTV